MMIRFIIKTFPGWGNKELILSLFSCQRRKNREIHCPSNYAEAFLIDRISLFFLLPIGAIAKMGYL
jgi:hypothetical protein